MKFIASILLFVTAMSCHADLILGEKACALEQKICLSIHIQKIAHYYSFVAFQKIPGKAWKELYTFPVKPVPTAPMIRLRCDKQLKRCIFAGNENQQVNHDAKVFIYTSTNFGHDWKKRDFPTFKNEQFSEVAGLSCRDDLSDCLLLVQSKKVNRDVIQNFVQLSKDQGQTWTSPIFLQNPKQEPILVSDIACNGFHKCFIAARKGTQDPQSFVYQSLDNGHTWKEQFFAVPNFKNLGTDFITHIRCQQKGVMCLALRYEVFNTHKSQNTVYQFQTDGHWKKIATLTHQFKGPAQKFDCDEQLKTCSINGNLTLSTVDGGTVWQESH